MWVGQLVRAAWLARSRSTSTALIDCLTLLGDRPKHFHRYVEGLIDKLRSLSSTALAYFRFTPDRSKDTRTALSDLVEAVMMILPSTLQTGDNIKWYETAAYAEIRPINFKRTEKIVPANRDPRQRSSYVSSLCSER